MPYCLLSAKVGRIGGATHRLWDSWSWPPGGLKTVFVLAMVTADSQEVGLLMARNMVKEIRQATLCTFSMEYKIRVVLERSRGEISVSEPCRREAFALIIYYRWPKSFWDAGENGLTRDMQRNATSDEVKRLKGENESLKKAFQSILDV